MPKKGSGLGNLDAMGGEVPFNESAAQAANTLREQQLANRGKKAFDEAIDDALITLPNGATQSLAKTIALIDHDYIPEDNRSIYANPEDFMIHVKPGHMYAWPSFKDPQTLAKIRSNLYRAVEISEIRDDSAVPIEVKPRAGKDFVCVGDVCLVEISPRGVSKLYHNREVQALLRTARNQSFATLQANLQRETNGMVTAEFTSEGS